MNISSFPFNFPFPWLLLHPQGACLQPARRCRRGAKSLCTLPWLSTCLCSGWSRAAGISSRSIPRGYGQATHQGTGNRATKSTQTPCRLAKASCYKPQLTSWESFPVIIWPYHQLFLLSDTRWAMTREEQGRAASAVQKGDERWCSHHFHGTVQIHKWTYQAAHFYPEIPVSTTWLFSYMVNYFSFN